MGRILYLLIATFILGTSCSCHRFQRLDREVKRINTSYFLRGQLTQDSITHETVWAFVIEKKDNAVIRIVDVE